jgi:hypothetical protein
MLHIYSIEKMSFENEIEISCYMSLNVLNVNVSLGIMIESQVAMLYIYSAHQIYEFSYRYH